MQKQLDQDYRPALSDLPKGCDWGAKKDTGGNIHCWKGYKAHIDYAPLQTVFRINRYLDAAERREDPDGLLVRTIRRNMDKLYDRRL